MSVKKATYIFGKKVEKIKKFTASHLMMNQGW